MQVPKSGTVVYYPHKIAAYYRGSLLMLPKSDRPESVQYSIKGLHRIGGTRVSLSCQLPGEVILYPDYKMPASLPLDQIAFEDALAWFSSQQMAALTAGYRLMFDQGTSGSYQEDVTINGMSYKAVLGQIEQQNLWFHMLTKPDGFKIAMRLAQLTRNASITQGTLSIYSHFAGNLMKHLGTVESSVIAPLTVSFSFLGK